MPQSLDWRSYLALCQHWLDVLPGRALSRVTEQVHDDCAFLDSLINVEQVDAWLPAVLYCLFPACTIFTHANDDIQAVVAKVETLTMALRAIADERESIVLEVFLGRGQWRFCITDL